jgi:Holliday junction resolvase RusA-like endonuclease
MSEILFHCTIPGRVAIKKNSLQRKYSFAKKRTVTIASDRFLTWAVAAAAHLNRLQGWRSTITGPLEATYRFYFPDHQHEPDVSNCIEGPQDLLAKAGVIENDKQIMRVIAEKFFGQEPRTEIELRRYEAHHEL